MDEVKIGMGPGGFCICPKCGFKKVHVAGIPCREEECPNCGVSLIREDSYHYNKMIEKNKKKKGGD